MKSSCSMYSSRENGTLRVPGGLILRVVHGIQPVSLVLREVGDDDLKRAHHGQGARRGLVQVVTQAVFEQRDVYDGGVLCHTDAVAEVADCFRRVATPAEARNGWHARVVPAVHIAAFDEA